MVWMCAAGLPLAVTPSWHAAQLPVTLAWSKFSICQRRVVWQLSQLAAVGTWLAGRPSARTPLWQSAQLRGVPEKVPSAWHAAQSMLACAPVSGKPVAK
ncbi:MAG: hypothetical protein GC147_13330 [Porphyrobacter sp.]|nr:hypothetical protein [Porphyrobacter sp.]